MTVMAPPTTYTTPEVAALLGISRQTLYRVAQRGGSLTVAGTEVWPIRAMTATRWPAAALEDAIGITPHEAARIIDQEGPK